MKRFVWFVTGMMCVPLLAAAEQAPPVPPAPPRPPAVAARPVPPPKPVPPLPPLPPVPPVPPVPPQKSIDMLDLENHLLDLKPDMQALKDHMLDMKNDLHFEYQQDFQIELEREAERMSRDAVRLSADDARRINEQARMAAADARNMVRRLADGGPFELQGPVIVGRGRVDEEGGLYNSGHVALQQRRYDQAITTFDRVIAQKGARSDGALYWKAFAQSRLVKTEDAIATLAVLRRDYPQSRYLNDAKVLEADVRKMAGQKVDPQAVDANDEIKLLALNGIANTEPDRAIPLLEGVLNATNTLAIKKRALYVLALNDDARAHQILLRYAKGGGNPELQSEAIRYLASRRDTPTRNTDLKEIYESTQDASVRRAVIEAYRNSGDKAALIAIAKGKTDTVELKRSAINGLANLAAPPELWALYQQETDASLREQMVNVFASMGAVEQLTAVVKTEKDPNVKMRALRALGNQSSEKTGSLLAGLSSGEQDVDVRRTIISALSNQSNVEALVAIARKETSLDLKREIVRRLSELAPKNKAAADYLMEVIK